MRPQGASRRRPGQVGELIRQVVAEALVTEVRDPRLRLVTVTRVEVSSDLSHARVLVLVNGDEESRSAALEGLERAAGFFRSRVAKVLAARVTPELRFAFDQGVEHAAKIDRILADLRQEEGES